MTRLVCGVVGYQDSPCLICGCVSRTKGRDPRPAAAVDGPGSVGAQQRTACHLAHGRVGTERAGSRK